MFRSEHNWTRRDKLNYVNMRQLRAKLGNRGRTTIYGDVKAKRLPKPVKIGSKLYWNESEVDAAIKALWSIQDRFSAYSKFYYANLTTANALESLKT